MPKLILTFIMLFMDAAVLGQKELKKGSSPNLSSQKTKSRWAISFSSGIIPLPDDPPSLQPGIEFYFIPQLSFLNEISLQTGKNKNSDSAALNKKYIRYKGEIRFYIGKVKKAIRPYLGLQFTTSKRSFDVGKTDRYYETFQDDSIFTYSRASIKSPIKTYTLQLGMYSRVIKKFYLDIALGYGSRVINTEYSSVINLQKNRNAGWFNIRPISSYKYIGELVRSQFTIIFKVSYKL